MNRIRLISIAAALLVILCLVVPVSASETVQLYMTKAIYAMNIGDDARAFSWFAKVLAIEPENVVALHLQGLVASRLGRLDRAEQILKECIAKNDAPAQAHFDLGVVLYSQGKYREAVVQFDVAGREGVDVPSLPYYLGASLFRLKEYERAVESLEFALETVPEQEANIRFYLGASFYALKKYRRAQRNLERSLELSPGPGVSKRAGELLTATIRDRSLAKWWAVQFEMGTAYDTNVLYEPENIDVTDEDGFYGFYAFDGTLYPLKRREGSIGVGYSYFQSIHYDPQDGVLGDFDMVRHAARLEGDARLISGYPSLYFSTDYEGSFVSLGGQRYQNQHQIIPGLTLTETPATATRLYADIRSKRFRDYQERDGMFYQPVVGQLFSFMNHKGRAAAELSYQLNEAEGDSFDYEGVRGYLGASVPLVSTLNVLSGVQYKYLDYMNHAENRIDRKITADLGLGYTLAENYGFQLKYRFARNNSIERYTWEKHVISLSVLFKF